MSTDLYRVSKSSWAVKYTPKGQEKSEVIPFATIELAADFLEKEVGISPDEVDVAIMDMTGLNASRGHFGNGVTDKGILYIGADDDKLTEHVGVA